MKSWVSYLKNALKRKLPEDPISKEKEHSNIKKNLKNLKPYILKYWRKGLLGALLVLFTSLLGFPIPLITRFLIDHVILEKKLAFLVGTVLLMVAIKMVAKLTGSFQHFYFTRFEQVVILNIQKDLINRTLRLPKTFFDSKETGYLMSRLLSDVHGLRWFFSSTLVYIISSLIRFIGGVALLFYLKWQLAIVVLFILPAIVLVVRFFAGKTRILSLHSMEQSAKVTSSMQESLSTTSLIKAFSTEKKTLNNIMKQLRSSIQIGLEHSIINSVANFSIGLLPEISRLIVLLAGAYWVILGEWSLGSLLAFQSYVGYVYGPAQFLASANINLQNALASLERVSALFDVIPEDNLEKGKKIKKLNGYVEFKNVCFSYNRKEKVLENLSFKVKPGEWIAIVGPSGVGKTTLLSLILSFYKPSKGEILFDNLPVSEYCLTNLRKRIGYVSQNPSLLSGTIMDNLMYGNKDASKDQVIKAAKIAGIHNFIKNLPKGYLETLGEQGMNLSEGQRQRLALGRALIKEPDIMILDEPTSALDSIVERSIFGALPELIQSKTLFIVTHKLSTVKKVNRILLLNENKLIATGTHTELMKNNHYYRTLIPMQNDIEKK